MGDVSGADGGVRPPAGDGPEAQAARRRALEEALIGVRAARRARKSEPATTGTPDGKDRTDCTDCTDGTDGTAGAETTDADRGTAESDDDAWPPAPAVPTLPWIDRATCQTADPALFFGPDVLSADGRRERLSDRHRRETEAKAYCAVCPVRAQCAEHALALPEPYGVWGGLGEIERLALVRRTVA